MIDSVTTLRGAKPLPYVTGESRRVKTEPTKITALSARMMLASGAFGGEGGVAVAARWPWGRVFAAVLMVSTMAVLGIAGDRAGFESRPAALAKPAAPQPDDLLTLGLAGYREERPRVTTDADAAATRPLDSRDQFEIARFTQRSAARDPNRTARAAVQNGREL